MKQTIILFSLCLPFFNAFADWNSESVNGLQTLWYLPKDQATKTKRALMINLHGCAQKAEDLKKDGNWETTADEFNMVIALPKVPNGGVYSGCWDYYGADHTRANRNNGPILDLVNNLLARAELNIDPGQVYISGLSSGGGESMVMGCLAPDIFAGMGLNAAPSTGTSVNEIGRPQTSYDKMLLTCKSLAGSNIDSFKTQMTSIIYGNNDFIVSTAHDTNNASIMSTIYEAKDKTTLDTKKLEGSFTDGNGTMFSDSKGSRVSLIMNSNLGHNWPAGQGGNGGNFISNKSINYPAYITKFFFENNRRSKSVKMPTLLVAPVISENSAFTISGSITIPRHEVRSIEVLVTDKISSLEVDRFFIDLNADGYFNGSTKKLAAGEYNFSLQLTKVSGISEWFNRLGWMGEVPGIMSPQLVNVNFQNVNDCLTIIGQAINNGGEKLTGVHIELDDREVALVDVKAASEWSYNICGLIRGVHTIGVYAENESALKSVIQNFNFEVAFGAATATLLTHMEAGRLSWLDYGVWYAKYGNKTFTLFQKADHTWSDQKINH